MCSLIKIRNSLNLFIIVSIVYFIFVTSVIDFMPSTNINYYGDVNNSSKSTSLMSTTIKNFSKINKSSQSELLSDKEQIYSSNLKAKLTTLVLGLKQDLNVQQNVTIIKNEFLKYIASVMANAPYAGVDNYTQYVTAKLNLKPLIGAKPLRPEFGPVVNDVTSYQYPIKIEPCRYVNRSTSLFVAIISAVGNYQKRLSIRQTWIRHFSGNQSDNSSTSINIAGYGFIIGQTSDKNLSVQIEEESKTYGDMLQVGITDNYYNLTLKAVGLLNWLNNHCSAIDFVLKVDDDVFVNVRNLGAVITKTLNRSELTFYGSYTYHPTERGGKWRISFEDYPWNMFPPYPTGGAVLLPGIAIEPLLAATQVVPHLPFDDTYILGLCAEKAGIKLHSTGRLFAIGGNFGPCHVHHFITWLPGYLNSMNISYLATEDFYKNVTQCIVVRDGMNQTANPFDYVLHLN